MCRSDHHLPLYVSIMGTSRHPIVNWSHYNNSLIHRGSLTFWVDAAAMNNWFHQDHHGRRGRNTLYTDQTICTFLMDSLCLRQGGRPVDLTQVSRDRFTLFPADVAQRMAHLMDDAQLDLGVRVDRLDGLREALDNHTA